MELYLINKLNNVFYFYTDRSLFENNHHIFIDNYNLFIQINIIINNIHILYNKSDISDYNIILKEDMHIKVFVLSNCIIRICNINIYNKFYICIYKYIIELFHPNLEQIYDIYFTTKYVIIVSKSIIPLVINNMINPLHKPNYTLLRNQMNNLIKQFINDGYAHNDVRIDNIGYDNENDLYVLFDFDKFNKSNINNDLLQLDNSIRYYN